MRERAREMHQKGLCVIYTRERETLLLQATPLLFSEGESIHRWVGGVGLHQGATTISTAGKEIHREWMQRGGAQLQVCCPGGALLFPG